MARFERCDTSNIHELNRYECYLVKGTLTLDDVSKLNGLNRKVVLIFENTRGQNSEVISGLNPSKINISVMGGLNYLKKKKYNDEDYVTRTFYTPKNLGNIIKYFESIERKINYSWTESQKCMFVYKTLAEAMHYTLKTEPEVVNNTDISRTLNGVLYNRAVCSGFALIFKEAMDRLGIECHYQNKPHHHSWNVVKLDGEYHALDLTWDACGKVNGCGFIYYCRQDSKTFYSNPHHDISNSQEEIRYPARSMDIEKLRTDYSRIVQSKQIYSPEMSTYTNQNNETYSYLLLGEKNGLLTYIVRNGDNINYFYINKDSDIRRVLSREILTSAVYTYNHNISRGNLPAGIKRFTRYKRSDGSNFLICASNAKLKDSVHEYIVIEPTTKNGKPYLKRSTILSENDLINVNDENSKLMIADYLLSPERLSRKVLHYNGYVGYISNHQVYYDRDFEVDKLGIQNRL